MTRPSDKRKGRQHVVSDYPFEEEYGYSRAILAGGIIYVSGTTARGDDLDADTYGQAKSILKTISETLSQFDASLDDVVRTVVYVTSLDDIALISKAHQRAFGKARPASTLVEVSKLTPARARVEFEVTAVRQ